MLRPPCAIRAACGPGAAIQSTHASPCRWDAACCCAKAAAGLALLAFGSLVASAERIGAELDATVVNMRYVKPIDEALIGRVAAAHRCIVTLEENVVAGGAGSAVSEVLAARGSQPPGFCTSAFPTAPFSMAAGKTAWRRRRSIWTALRAQIDGLVAADAAAKGRCRPLIPPVGCQCPPRAERLSPRESSKILGIRRFGTM